MENNIKNIYFLGIGGVGMSGLAQYFKLAGYNVAGYDRVKSELCDMLENIGVNIHYEENINLIPEIYKNPDYTIVVFTPAIPGEHRELEFFKSHNFSIYKRAQILGMIANQKYAIAIAGSHGKTSVSGICTNILLHTKNKCSAFLGGILKNINSNFINHPESDYVVAEADEYDRSFHQLFPTTAVITYIEPDHLDIYHTYENLYNAYLQFANQIKQGGSLLLSNHVDIDFQKNVNSSIKVFRYSVNDEDYDFSLKNIHYENGFCYFDIQHPTGLIKNIKYQIGGNHNLENALAAASLCLVNNIDEDSVRKGLESYQGIKRRFDYIINTKNLVYIDDYAHHPSELEAFVKSVRLLYPGKHITGIFQPHLYSRTKDFYKEFARSLELCDRVILLPIYPARELPIPGVESDLILENLHIQDKMLCSKQELTEILKSLDKEVIITMGAGDIDMLVQPIKTTLLNEEADI